MLNRSSLRFPVPAGFLRRSLLVLALLLAAGCGQSTPGGTTAEAPANPKVPKGAKSSGGRTAVIETEKGAIEFELFDKDAPKAAENFRLLAEHGYYDGLTFHRVLKGFMIQGGDPKGNGTGGESAWGGKFADEISSGSELYRAGYKRGIVAMANAGPNTNSSQFFIMHQDYPLPPAYVIFGKVTKGLEVVDALAAWATTTGMDGDRSQPVTPIIMRKVTIRP